MGDRKPSFLDSPPHPDDLEGTMEYLSPLSRGDLSESVMEHLSPEPFPEATEAPPEPEPHHTLLDEYDMEPERFAQMALDRPELWDDASTQRLYDVLEGAPVAQHELDSLAEDFLTGTSRRVSQLSEEPREQRSEVAEIDIELNRALEPELVDESPRPQPDPSLQDFKPDLDSVDKWWEK